MTATLLLRGVRTKIAVRFEVEVQARLGKLEVQVRVEARVVYGEGWGEEKMGEFLRGRVGGVGGWAGAVRELEERVGGEGGR